MIRLPRKPSLWMPFFGRLIFAAIWAGIFIAASWWMWIHRFGMPTYGLVILAIFDVVTIGVAWDIVARFRSTSQHREPLVEVERDPVKHGDTIRVRIVTPNPDAIAEIGVKLVGECYARAEREFTAYRETVITLTRCYEDDLLRLEHEDNSAIDETVQMHIPQSPPADDVSWKIVVDTRLREGAVMEHPFPFRVIA